MDLKYLFNRLSSWVRSWTMRGVLLSCFGIALVYTVVFESPAEAAQPKLLGMNAQGAYVFNVDGTLYACLTNGDGTVSCMVQGGDPMVCEFRPVPEYFANCKPGLHPTRGMPREHGTAV